VDESNFDRVLHELKILATRYPDAGRLVEALEEMDFDPEAGLLPGVLSVDDLGAEYAEFAGGCAHQWRPSA